MPRGDGGNDSSTTTTGPAWTSLELKASVGTVKGIWGASTSDVWFVTNSTGGSSLLHYAGGGDVTGNDLNGTVNAIWGTASNNIWILGNQGAYATYDGKNWIGQSTFTSGDIYATWGVSTAWAVGRYVGVNNLRRTNTNLTDWEYGDKYDLPRTATGKLYSVSGSGAVVYVAGEPGLWMWNGTWTQLSTNETRHVYAIPGGAIATDGLKVQFIAGGQVFETDAQPPDLSASTHFLNALWGSSENDLWVAGTSGYLAHFDGQSWTRTPAVTTADIVCIWGKTSDDIWAGGEETLLRYRRP